MSKLYPLFRFFSILLAVTILLPLQQYWLVSAQSTPDASWTTPDNLSNSGLTSLPGIVSDQNGVVHAVWQDDTLGTMYSQLVDDVWSQPEVIGFPFTDFVPKFVDGGDYIYAFWLNTQNDSLNQSRVPFDRFGTNAWERAKILARGVEDFAVVYQDANTLHLAYMTSLEGPTTPTGTYYIRSIDGGVKWDTAKPIYTSRYFRALDSATTNVDISAGMLDDQPVVYLVWNNPALKRNFLSRSLDNGETWGEPIQLDGPSLTNTSSSPYNPMVTASGADVLLIWQSNLQSGFACTQYYQSSQDGGATWSERTRMLGEFVGCAEENIFLPTSQGITLLQTTLRDEVYHLAWDGERWSRAYPQSTLSGFSDPLTNEPVSFRCRQNTVQLGTTLFVIGCNEKGNQDVWVTSKAVGTVEDWFPSAALWEAPITVVESQDEISSAQAVTDMHGAVHILWRQVDDSEDGNLHRSIHYARLKDNLLSQPARILTSPDRLVDDFSVAYDPSRDRLSVVWTAATTGEMYYSWADVSRASSTFEWSKAIIIPTDRTLTRSPNILITPNGMIHVAYAIPLNEDRGIYLTTSSDGGENWEQTMQVYLVTEPEWQAIDFPKLASTGDEILHIIWRRENIIGDAGIVGLYYARSDDGGQTWSAPQNVTSESVVGAWIIDGADQGVRRFWLASSDIERSFFHDASLDQGINWRIQENLTGFGETPGIASPFVDTIGWINFAQAIENSPHNLVINHQRDDNGRWSILDSLEIGEAAVEEITSLSAQSMLNGRLALAYTFKEMEPKEGEAPYSLYLALQSEDAVQSTATDVARLATETPPTPIPEQTLDVTELASTPTPTESMIAPTPSVIFTTPAPQEPLTIDTTTGLALSVGLAVLVVLVFFVYTRLRRS